MPQVTRGMTSDKDSETARVCNFLCMFLGNQEPLFLSLYFSFSFLVWTELKGERLKTVKGAPDYGPPE
jgi:hypothetical protein